jgi:excisionase family DNA binding protein
VCSSDLKTVYRKIAAGEIRAQRISANCIRIAEDDLEQYRQALKDRQPYTRQK